MAYVSRFGLDPEVAIVSRKSGKARSAHEFLGDETIQFNFYTDSDKNKEDPMLGSEVSRDGAAIEVRSLVDSACRDNIIPYMAEALRQTALRLEKWKKNAYVLSSTPKYVLMDSTLKDAPKDVAEFGCNPDFDAYALQPKSPSLDPSDRRRWTGGHIHVSGNLSSLHNNVQQQAALAIMFDYFVALPMVALLGERFAEGEAERRLFYGQPGSFRWDNNLGKMEFRTLSGRLMLHPTVLAWAMGMTRSMINSNTQGADYMPFLKKKVIPTVSTETVYNGIMQHDVGLAEELVSVLFPLLPNYLVDESALANPMTGSGAGTCNPYFYEQAMRVFIEGNRQGLGWGDDMAHNWGLYENYFPKHHAYWGIQQAMVGLLDDDIFPYNAVLAKVWPKGLIQKAPIYTHPKNGGAWKYVKPGAAGWLA